MLLVGWFGLLVPSALILRLKRRWIG